MSPQRFRVEEADLPGERVSGITDERPEVDSDWHARHPGVDWGDIYPLLALP
jgi:hypothetical protein